MVHFSAATHEKQQAGSRQAAGKQQASSWLDYREGITTGRQGDYRICLCTSFSFNRQKAP